MTTTGELLTHDDLSYLRIEVIQSILKSNGMAADKGLPQWSREIYLNKIQSLYGVYQRLGGSLELEKLL